MRLHHELGHDKQKDAGTINCKDPEEQQKCLDRIIQMRPIRKKKSKSKKAKDRDNEEAAAAAPVPPGKKGGADNRRLFFVNNLERLLPSPLDPLCPAFGKYL